MGLVIEFGTTSRRVMRRRPPLATGEVMFFPGVRIERHAERDRTDASVRRAENWLKPRWGDLDER
jgi:hypothetical protein